MLLPLTLLGVLSYTLEKAITEVPGDFNAHRWLSICAIIVGIPTMLLMLLAAYGSTSYTLYEKHLFKKQRIQFGASARQVCDIASKIPDDRRLRQDVDKFLEKTSNALRPGSSTPYEDAMFKIKNLLERFVEDPDDYDLDLSADPSQARRVLVQMERIHHQRQVRSQLKRNIE